MIGRAFHEQGHLGHAKPGTAVFFGNHDAQKAVIGNLLEHVPGKFMFPGMPQPIIVVEFLRQLTAVFVDLALFVVQSEFHVFLKS